MFSTLAEGISSAAGPKRPTISLRFDAVTTLAEPEVMTSRAPNPAPAGGAQPRLHVVDRGPIEGPRPALTTRMRFQLAGAVLLGVVLPFCLEWNDPWTNSLNSAANTAIGVFLAIVCGFYVLRRITSFPTHQEVGSVIPVFTTAFAAVIAFVSFSRLDYNRLQLFAGFVLTIGWFLFVLSAARHASRKQFALVPVGEALSIRDLKSARWRVIEPNGPLPNPCAGVVVDLRADLPAQWEQFLTQCALSGVPVYHFKHVREQMTGRLEIEHVSENILGAHNPNSGYLKFKRVVDFLVASVALVVLSPFLLLVAAIIRLDSKGPALYKQARIAQGGAPFMIYKFRTMYADTSKAGSRVDAMTKDRDPRITRIGGFLRKSRIDELPQINCRSINTATSCRRASRAGPRSTRAMSPIPSTCSASSITTFITSRTFRSGWTS